MLDNLTEKIGGLWSYLTENWLSLRFPDKIIAAQHRRFDLPHLLLGDLQRGRIKANALLLHTDIILRVIGCTALFETGHCTLPFGGAGLFFFAGYKLGYNAQRKRDLQNASP